MVSVLDKINVANGPNFKPLPITIGNGLPKVDNVIGEHLAEPLLNRTLLNK